MSEEIKLEIPTGNLEQIANGWRQLCFRILLMDDEQLNRTRLTLLRNLHIGRDFNKHLMEALQENPEILQKVADIDALARTDLPVVIDKDKIKDLYLKGDNEG